MTKALWSIVIGLLAPLLAGAATLDLPPQPLGPSLQQLAKQSGVQIIFFSKLVEGREAPALAGSFTPGAALDVLLAGTGLTYHVLNDRTIEVAQSPRSAASPPANPPASRPLLDEVEITAERTEPGAMRREIEKLEDQFFAQYNELNTDRRFDIHCRRAPRNNSHLLFRTCAPAFVGHAQAEVTRRLRDENAGPWAYMLIQQKTPDYQKNMTDILSKHPELLELLEARNELAQRYEALSKRKLERVEIPVRIERREPRP